MEMNYRTLFLIVADLNERNIEASSSDEVELVIWKAQQRILISESIRRRRQPFEGRGPTYFPTWATSADHRPTHSLVHSILSISRLCQVPKQPWIYIQQMSLAKGGSFRREASDENGCDTTRKSRASEQNPPEAGNSS